MVLAGLEGFGAGRIKAASSRLQVFARQWQNWGAKSKLILAARQAQPNLSAPGAMVQAGRGGSQSRSAFRAVLSREPALKAGTLQSAPLPGSPTFISFQAFGVKLA